MMMILILLIKIINMLRIQMNQKYKFLFKNLNKIGIEDLEDPMALLNIQMICKMSIKILKSTTYIENVKCKQYLVI